MITANEARARVEDVNQGKNRAQLDIIEQEIMNRVAVGETNARFDFYPTAAVLQRLYQLDFSVDSKSYRNEVVTTVSW